jgi:hypothetical protein
VSIRRAPRTHTADRAQALLELAIDEWLDTWVPERPPFLPGGTSTNRFLYDAETTFWRLARDRGIEPDGGSGQGQWPEIPR